MADSEYQCKLCGYKWVSRVDLPKQCPRCKRYDWQKSQGESFPEAIPA